MHTDHDHKTGIVRKLLCARCNHVVGILETNETDKYKEYIKACLLKVGVTPKEVADQRIAVTK